ncbi:MAG: tetratricopeptide repeat protein [bacterium]
MKRIVLTVIALIFLHLTYGQQPTQAPAPQSIERSMGNLPLISEPRSFLETATGWMLQDNGEWISDENRIPFKDSEFNKSSKALYKLGKENFEFLQLRDVVLNNEIYCIFVIVFRTGWYEFPILLEGWHKQQGISYFVFKKSKLLEVVPDKIEFNKPNIINMDVVCEGTLVDFDIKTLNSTVAYHIQKTFADKTIASHNLLMAVMPLQSGGESLMRFRLIQVTNKKKFYLPYLDVKDRDKLFRSSYYETDLESFRSFIRYDAGAVSVPQFAGSAKTPEEFFKRGISNYSLGNYGQSIADFTEASKFPPYTDFFLTYAYRANARQKAGDNFEALHDFDRAVSLKPADQGYYSAWLTTIYNRGVAKYNLKDYEGACQDWQTAIQMGFKDIGSDQTIKENCKNYKFSASSLTPNTVPSTVPGSSSPTDKQTDYYKVYWEGVWKYDDGNYSEALKNFNRALELKPQANTTTIYNYRGNCKLKLNDYNGAVGDFSIAINYSASSQTDNNTLKTTYYNRGLANYFLGNTNIACSDFNKSISLGLTESNLVQFIRQVCK